MKISADATSSQINTIKRNRIKLAKKQFKELDKIYKQRLTDKVISGEKKLAIAKTQVEKKLNNISNNQQKKISQWNKNIEDKKMALDMEEKQLEKEHVEERIQNNSKFQRKLIDEDFSYKNLMNDIKFNHRTNLSDLLDDQDTALIRTVDRSNTKISNLNQDHREIASQQKNYYERIQLNEQRKQLEQIIDQRNQFKKNYQKNDYENKRKFKTLVRYHQQMQAQQTKMFKDRIVETDKDFKKKFATILDRNQKLLSSLKDRINNDIADIKNKLTSSKETFATKTEDPFYHLKTLHPQVEKMSDHYLISIKINPHEHDMVQLMGKSHDLRITFTRNNKDDITQEDGSRNQYSKSESYTKSIKLDRVVDSNKITKQYNDQDDIVLFKVPFA